MQINFHSIVWSSNQSGWSNHPKPKLKWVVKVICTVWNHEYKKSVKKSRSPHALSQVSQTFQYCFPKSVISDWLHLHSLSDPAIAQAAATPRPR